MRFATLNTSVGLTWENILIVNRHYEPYLRSNMFFILVFEILSTVKVQALTGFQRNFIRSFGIT